MTRVDMQYDLAKTTLGWLLVAYSAQGVRRVALGDSRTALEASLLADYAGATIEQAPERHAWVRAVIDRVEGSRSSEVPVDVAGSDFQRRVWSALAEIPRGETRSYAAVATAIGRPGSARAVARACATNEVAVIVPCHRVIRGDGSMSGYRWGVDRKARMLEQERLTA